MSKLAAELTENAVDPAFLRRYQQAWEENDVETIVSMMTPDALYEASFGPEPWGQRFVGRDAIRAGILGFRAASTSVASTHDYDETYTFGNRAVATWTSTSTGQDGVKTSVHGCDIYEFRDGLVAKKIAFRKAKG